MPSKKILSGLKPGLDSLTCTGTFHGGKVKPMVCSPEDAYHCFMATNMDVLVLEDFVLLKGEQPSAEEHPIDQYLARFALD